MSPRLRQHANTRIDQDDGKVGGRRASHHVARVLLVPRAIGDDELAPVRREIAIGNIDRDALFAFGGQPVDQQRKVDGFALRAKALAVALKRGKLIVEQRFRLEKQTPDQCRLAVVD